ncbi:MAG: ATP-binding cassette domain-containing protein [Myxococcales bacterium]|nr:ATP-binding cassette domain-containing protein [Myxococcales bacterium]
MALIEFENVRKAFGPKVVYESLNLEIQKGEALTVIGGSGMGKSVMLKMLIGLMRVDGGVIRFDGQVISNVSQKKLAAVRKRIGMLFQGAALFDSLNVRDNIAYPLLEHGNPTKKEVDVRVAECLEDVGLPGIGDYAVAQLSGGMRKRIGLARAIALRPEVLLYDEPTTGLDPIAVAHIVDLIVELNDRYHVTTVVVTHDMPAAFRISDRIAMIDRGYIIFEGSPDEIRYSEDARVTDFIEGIAPETDDIQTLLRYGG